MSEKPFTAEGPAVTTAYVVLLVENELLERVSTATHLRKSGFDVIEAADGDEARRVLDSVHVNVVFADLAMPGQTNGLALLRWLRERHPAIKTILTSGTETNMAALDDYGIFLSKPYRLVDLDYCLQKALATASIPANETGGAMTADPSRKTSPEPGKAQPGSANPSRPPAPGKADGRDDEISKQSMVELSRRLGERAARQRAVDPGAAKAARRAALQEYDRARVRRLRLVLGFAVGAVVGSGIAYLVPTVGSRPVPPSPSAAASTEPASPIDMATAAPAPAPPDSPSPSPAPSSPSPAASVPSAPAVEPAAAQAAPAADSQPAPAPPESAASPLPPPASGASAQPSTAARTEPAPATTSQQAPLEPEPNPAPLQRDEVRDVQARLRSFGFNPGSVDGVPGPTTEGAVMHYQQDRGQLQTGKVDGQLLEQLRQDPAPQIAQRAARPDARATRSPGARRSDPFEPVRVAGNRLGQWLESLTR
jgi:CheY-like chemotaxis protein